MRKEIGWSTIEKLLYEILKTQERTNQILSTLTTTTTEAP